MPFAFCPQPVAHIWHLDTTFIFIFFLRFSIQALIGVDRSGAVPTRDAPGKRQQCDCPARATGRRGVQRPQRRCFYLNRPHLKLQLLSGILGDLIRVATDRDIRQEHIFRVSCFASMFISVYSSLQMFYVYDCFFFSSVQFMY